MAGEMDSQLHIQPRAGRSFFTYVARDVLGREIPGLAEASSEAAVRRLFEERGYAVTDLKDGWRAPESDQSFADRKEAVEERLRAHIRTILEGAADTGVRTVRIALNPSDGLVHVAHLQGDELRPTRTLPPDLWPDLRRQLAGLAGIPLPKYQNERRGRIPLRRAAAEITFKGNAIELQLSG